MANFYEELHARPFISIKAPKLISVVAFMIHETDQKSSDQEFFSKQEIEKLITYLYQYYVYSDFIPKSKEGKSLLDLFITQQLIRGSKDNKNVYVVLQKHTSFFCITFIEGNFIEEGEIVQWDAIPPKIKQDYGNLLDRAAFKTHIRIEKLDPNQADRDYKIQKTFNYGIDTNNPDNFRLDDWFMQLLCSMVSDGGAVVWTPFCSFYDDFNRILVRDISLRPARLGRLVRRLIEIDLYSTLALRNFNEAREQLISLRGIENDLSETLKESFTDYQDCYNKVIEMARKIANIVAKSRYNFQATVAYSDLVWQRINELREQRVEGWTRISYFLEKRFRPCVRTCEAALRAQGAVFQEIQGVANLLEAGLSVELQKRSGDTLEKQEEILNEVKKIMAIQVDLQKQEVDRTQKSGETLQKQEKILSEVNKIMKIQHNSEKDQRKFEKIVEFLALFPITYYISSLIEKIAHLDKIIYPLTLLIIFLSAFLLLFDPKWNGRVRKLVEKDMVDKQIPDL